MNERFDDGWIPKGWRRGDPLRMHEPHRKYAAEWMGAISQEFCPSYKDAAPDHVAFIAFRWHEKEKVQAWLKWWGAVP